MTVKRRRAPRDQRCVGLTRDLQRCRRRCVNGPVCHAHLDQRRQTALTTARMIARRYLPKRVTNAQLDYVLWNETAFPFNAMEDWIVQLHEYFAKVAAEVIPQ